MIICEGHFPKTTRDGPKTAPAPGQNGRDWKETCRRLNWNGRAFGKTATRFKKSGRGILQNGRGPNFSRPVF
jgi:hypothetical protein